ncbi:MAG TPA: amidophosphoribosyltransferase, partial [Chloroflexota bacterium]|nr:amidophosphoribosyltransferase [Chloroflexota bacterium]
MSTPVAAPPLLPAGEAVEPPLCPAAAEAGEPPPREACGVIGVLGRPGLDAGRVTYFGLYALQ